MQKYATILEVCRLLELGASVRDIRSRTRLGHSTINLIHSRMRSSSLSFSQLQDLDPEQVEGGFSINGASLKPLKIQVVECHKKNNLNSRMRRNEKWQSNMTKNLRNR